MYDRSSAEFVRWRLAWAEKDNLRVSPCSTCFGPIADRFSGAGGIVVGTILQAASINYGMMLFARVFNGVFNGMLTSTVPTYQSECARPHQRGQLLLFSGSLITFVSHLLSIVVRIAQIDTIGYHDLVLGGPRILLHHRANRLAIPSRIPMRLHFCHVSPARYTNISRSS